MVDKLIMYYRPKNKKEKKSWIEWRTCHVYSLMALSYMPRGSLSRGNYKISNFLWPNYPIILLCSRVVSSIARKQNQGLYAAYDWQFDIPFESICQIFFLSFVLADNICWLGLQQVGPTALINLKTNSPDRAKFIKVAAISWLCMVPPLTR